MTERELQDAVLELAALTGWMAHHDRPAQRADGSWTTAIQGDVGFPDLVLLRAPRLIFAELKAERGSLTLGQTQWLGALELVRSPTTEVHVWRPIHWTDGTIIEALRR